MKSRGEFVDRSRIQNYPSIGSREKKVSSSSSINEQRESKPVVSQDSHSVENCISQSHSIEQVGVQSLNSIPVVGIHLSTGNRNSEADPSSESELPRKDPVQSEKDMARKLKTTRVDEANNHLTLEQVAFRQKKKNDYSANELEAWPLYQLFVENPQLFFGLATVGVFVFLLILQVHFMVTLLLTIAVPFGVVKLWRENPKALLIAVYSFAAVVLLTSVILIHTVVSAEESVRQY